MSIRHQVTIAAARNDLSKIDRAIDARTDLTVAQQRALRSWAYDRLAEQYRADPYGVEAAANPVWREVEKRASTSDCTGIAARWCPNCGDCTNDPAIHADDLAFPHSDHCSDRDCPLHGVASKHAEAT